MLFFVDESWQTVSGIPVGALGAVAIPQSGYNAFCREFFRMKRDVLGAQELNHSEIRGQHAFAKSCFKRQELRGDSHWLGAADGVFELLRRHRARTFAVWTQNPDYVSLRSSHTTVLSDIYKKLLWDFLSYMRRETGARRLGSLNFDQRGRREDEASGCAVQNYLVRTRGAEWLSYFIGVPNFTVSSVSPGLQSADVVAHLGAHLVDRSARPELDPYIEQMLDRAYVAGGNRRCVTQVR